MNRALVEGGEDPRAIAAVLAHELTHALQIHQDLGGRPNCVRREVDAHLTEAYVWARLWDGHAPPVRTALERHLDEVTAIAEWEGEAGLERFVVGQPSYRRQCELWGPRPG